MIPNNVQVAEKTGSLGGRKIAMRISEKGVPYLMNLLTDLYSDPVLACIREYSTNAWDSHVDAGNTSRPIEVTLPNRMSPYFIIRDFGIGMDADTIEEIYSQYGESTKREQKTTNGSMGIGAKAALGYTSQFMVTGWKNGVKTLVAVGREEDGTGSMDIVYEGPDDGENGVEIRIPVQRESDFEYKAREFYSYWKPGMVLLDGDDPSLARKKITDRIYEHNSSRYDVVVMGNVAYPIDASYGISGGGSGVVCYVTMNGDDEVVFAPSRESLIYNDLTKSSLAGLREDYNKAIRTHLQSELNQCATFVDAWSKMQNIRSSYSMSIYNELRFKGMAVDNFMPSEQVVQDDGTVKNNTFQFVKWQIGKTRHAVERGGTFFENLIDRKNVIIVNYRSEKGVSGQDKKRIKEYFDEHVDDVTLNYYYYNSSTVFLTKQSALPNPDRLGGLKVYDWKHILKVTRTPQTTGGSGITSGGKFYTFDGSGFEYGDIDDKDVVYWSSADHSVDRDLLRRAQKLHPDVLFVNENKNRHTRIQRLANSATEWGTWYTNTLRSEIAKADFDALTVDNLKVLGYHHVYDDVSHADAFGTYNKYEFTPFYIDVKNGTIDIDDPDFKEAILWSHAPRPYIGFAAEDARYRDAISKHGPSDAVRWIRKYYPLINGNNIRYKTQIAEYINSEYAKRNGV